MRAKVLFPLEQNKRIHCQNHLRHCRVVVLSSKNGKRGNVFKKKQILWVWKRVTVVFYAAFQTLAILFLTTKHTKEITFVTSELLTGYRSVT